MLGVPELRSEFRYLDAARSAFNDRAIDAVPAALRDLGPDYVNHPASRQRTPHLA